MNQETLRNKILKSTTLKYTDTINDSKIYQEREGISTSIPMLNVALSGTIDGGMTPGVTMIAGPSKHFKSLFGLTLAHAFQKKYPNGIILLYDSEFGTPKAYFKSLDIDMKNVIHCPITNIEELKIDIMNQLNQLDRKDEVLIIIDSLGNLASKKEVDDALDGKSVTDMTRAKAIKSLFRSITPHLTLKAIPLIVINHTYKEQSLFPKDIVSGGCLGYGTKIQMADGTTEEIQNIKEKALVKTLLGNKEVTTVWNPDTLDDGIPECYEIEFDDGYKVICSKNHKFILNNNWVDAEILKEGDIVKTI